MAAALSLTLMGDSFLYAVLPTQATALGIPLSAVGILLSINRFVRFFTNEWAGRAYARGVGERIFLRATVAATVSTWAYILPWGFWSFLFARALWGTSYSFLRLGNFLSVLRRTREEERGHWLGRVKAINRIATTLATAFGGYLTDRIGYHLSVGLFGTVTAVASVISWREARLVGADDGFGAADSGFGPRVQNEPESGDARHSSAVQDATRPQKAGDASDAREHISRDDVPPPLRPKHYTPAGERTRLWTTYFGSFAHGLITHGLVTGTIALVLMQRYGEHIGILGQTVGVATLSGIVLAVRWFADIFIAPLSGRLADRMSRRRIAIVASFLQSGALAVLAFSTNPIATIVSIWAVFILAIVLAISLESIAGEIGMRGDLSMVMSRFSTVQDVGSALGPFLGFSLGIGLGLKTLYLAAGGVVALVGVLFWRLTTARSSSEATPT